MINPVVHTLMVAQVRFSEYEFATPVDAIDVAARSLFNPDGLVEEIRQLAREYFNANDSFTSAIAAVYNDIATLGHYRPTGIYLGISRCVA